MHMLLHIPLGPIVKKKVNNASGNETRSVQEVVTVWSGIPGHWAVNVVKPKLGSGSV